MIPRDKFINQILIPETVILLITEDLNVDEKTALAILQESKTYETHGFPIDNEISQDEYAYLMQRTTVAEGKKRNLNPSPVIPSVSPLKKKGRINYGQLDNVEESEEFDFSFSLTRM